MVAMLDQHDEKIEDLRLHGDEGAFAADLVRVRIDRARSDAISHRSFSCSGAVLPFWPRPVT